MSLLAQASVLLAAFQAVMVARNSGLYNALPEGEGEASLSVLIPARNEERNLAVLLESLRQQRGANFEVVVLDDNSSDGTLAIAGAYAEADARFRVVSAPPLPGGWAGKQHACHLLSLQASMPQWLFLDADVVLTDPRALAKIARHVAGLLRLAPAPGPGAWRAALRH